MRKILTLIIAVLLLAGCATTQQNAYVVPDDIKERGIAINEQVVKCIAPSSRTGLAISRDQSPNAMFKDGWITITEGMFQFDDNALKFVLAHEIAHQKLGHVQKAQALSLSVTGAMIVIGSIVPGAGILNHAVNPAVVNNYSKFQEDDADLEAYNACLCMGMSKDDVVTVMQSIRAAASEGGGFWDRHPSWDNRIANIQNAH